MSFNLCLDVVEVTKRKLPLPALEAPKHDDISPSPLQQEDLAIDDDDAGSRCASDVAPDPKTRSFQVLAVSQTG